MASDRVDADIRRCASMGFSDDIGIATRLRESCWVSDDEGTRRTTPTPMKRSPSRSLSFSVGTTPGKKYPTRFVLFGLLWLCLVVPKADSDRYRQQRTKS